MLEIPVWTLSTLVFVEIQPFTDAGAPADPTGLPVTMSFSLRKHPTTAPSPFSATWVTNTKVQPPRYAVSCAVGANTAAGALPVGLWYPFVTILANPEIPSFRGEPFRVV